jgi:hypothetical protein
MLTRSASECFRGELLPAFRRSLSGATHFGETGCAEWPSHDDEVMDHEQKMLIPPPRDEDLDDEDDECDEDRPPANVAVLLCALRRSAPIIPRFRDGPRCRTVPTGHIVC